MADDPDTIAPVLDWAIRDYLPMGTLRRQLVGEVFEENHVALGLLRFRMGGGTPTATAIPTISIAVTRRPTRTSPTLTRRRPRQ